MNSALLFMFFLLSNPGALSKDGANPCHIQSEKVTKKNWQANIWLYS